MSDNNIVYDGLRGLTPDDEEEDLYKEPASTSTSYVSEVFDFPENKKDAKRRKDEQRKKKLEEKENERLEAERLRNQTNNSTSTKNLPDWLKVKK